MEIINQFWEENIEGEKKEVKKLYLVYISTILSIHPVKLKFVIIFSQV